LKIKYKKRETQKNKLGGVNMRKYVAEFIGTFVLTFTACGAASFTGGYSGYLGVVGIALIFGLVVVAMAYSIGNISGCHINPAVSIGMFAAGRMSAVDFMGYVIGQILGGIAGAFALFGLTKSFDPSVLDQYKSYGYDLAGLGTNGFGDQSAFLKINMWGAIVAEIILSFIFVLTFIGVTAKEEYKKIAGIVVGLSLTAVHLFGIMLTGTSVNPARSFGPALVKAIFGDKTPLTQVWVFILAPLVGGILAALVYSFLSGEGKKAKADEPTDAVTDVELTDVSEDK
jgi:aquaporin Z